MPDTYKLQYDGMTLTYPGWNGCVSYEAAPAFKTLTLYHSEGGTLTANTLTGYPGDTVSLSTAYNTYWRFSGYQMTGDGELVGNDYTFGTEDATICACYKVNAFTATGGWEKGSDVTCSRSKSGTADTNVPAKYAIHGAHTGEIPAAWYSTSNRWKVTSTVSAYKITLNPKMTFQGTKSTDRYDSFSMTGVSLVGSTQSNSQSFSSPGTKGTYTYNYSKSFTSNTTGVNYGVSARLHISIKYGGNAKYVAAGTTGTWTATGIAP